MTPQQLQQQFEDAKAILATARALGQIDPNTYNFGMHIVMRMQQGGAPRLILQPKTLHGRALKIDGELFAAPPVVHLHDCIDILQQLHFAGGIMNGPDVQWVRDEPDAAQEHFTLDPFMTSGISWDTATPIVFAINCNSIKKANTKLDDAVEQIESEPSLIDNFTTAVPAIA